MYFCGVDRLSLHCCWFLVSVFLTRIQSFPIRCAIHKRHAAEMESRRLLASPGQCWIHFIRFSQLVARPF